MEFINLKKCKQKIIQNKYSQITLTFYYFISGLILIIYFADYDFATIITILGFIITYYLRDKKFNFFKTLIPIYTVIYIRHFLFIVIIYSSLLFLNYQVFDQALEGSDYDLFFDFYEIIPWFNILINFISVQKNSIIFNQVE